MIDARDVEVQCHGGCEAVRGIDGKASRIGLPVGDIARIRPADCLQAVSHRLHQLKGDLRGHWAVTVRANWRIIWRFEGADAVDVDLIDYHQE